MLTREALLFERPQSLNATTPAEWRGVPRDGVRLLVSSPKGHEHARFRDLPKYLQPGDLLVVNRSATLPASLPATAQFGNFVLNLSTHYGRGLWLAEPRWSVGEPGPLPLKVGTKIEAARVPAKMVAPYPKIPRLWFVQFEGDISPAVERCGRPIRYGYIEGEYPLSVYQTVFADTPGSVEMPSAAYPFTQRVVAALRRRGVEIAEITLHTGVSSLEVEVDNVEEHPLYAEPFSVPAETAAAVNEARANGRRIIAVGTTVVRALESAWDDALKEVRATSGFTRLYIHPKKGIHAIDGLISGLHDSATSHLAMLYAIVGQPFIEEAYAAAIEKGYLWHEFGDSHLILR